jgi:hypothetical protein
VVKALGHHTSRVAFVVDQDVVEALLAKAAAKALDETTRRRCPGRGLEQDENSPMAFVWIGQAPSGCVRDRHR